MDKQQILIINDLCGTGKVATAAMLPILSYMGHPTYTLPTALVSNTLEYAKFSIVDTTDYIKSVFPVWRELGFSFSAIATGFIASERQAAVVSEYCKQVAAEGTVIYVDPIMGDEGRLYNGVTPVTIDSMREMVAVADLIYPNYTEACYLTGIPYSEDGVTKRRPVRCLTGCMRSEQSRCSSRRFPWTISIVWWDTIISLILIFSCPIKRFLFGSPEQVTSSPLFLSGTC